MKMKNCLVMLTASAAVLISAGQSKAQSQLSCDCIAASPRVRQMMEDQKAMLPAMGGGEFVAGESMRGELVVAPPRAREQIVGQDRERASIIVDNEPETVGYRATCHGITASPRVHQMLKDQRSMVEIYAVR